jgi:hypothetical protein
MTNKSKEFIKELYPTVDHKVITDLKEENARIGQMGAMNYNSIEILKMKIEELKDIIDNHLNTYTEDK